VSSFALRKGGAAPFVNLISQGQLKALTGEGVNENNIDPLLYETLREK